MQPSAPKYAHKLPPLRDEAAKLSPGFSGPGLATLLERFNESPSEAARAAPFTAQPALPRGTDPARPDGAGRRKMPAAALAPTATAKSRLTLGSVVSVLAGVMLVPISFLFFLWWQDSAPQDKEPSEILTVESAPAVVQPAQSASTSEVALAAPDGVETATRPSISPEPPQVATVDMPASLPLPAAVATADEAWTAPETVATADESLALPTPAADAAVDGPESASPAEEIAQAEATGSIVEAAPAPQRRPAVKVNTVKTVAIAPPRETMPYDGAMALGSPAEPQSTDEWMETKTAVDMHAKAEQSSETVKVADGGLKVRVTGRDKRWVQVTDPATSTTGWIYDRFLIPAEPPAP
jgi:hypothetical protein